MRDFVWADELTGERAEDVRALLLAARETDGRPDVEPGGSLPGEFAGPRHLLGLVGEGPTTALAAYAHLDQRGDAFGRQVAELIVHPAHRRRGHGAAALEEVLRRSSGPLRVWSHGDHPAAARLAERFGLSRARELLVMGATAAEHEWPEPALPDGVRLRTFVPGRDERAVIEVNARAFDWHPEQSAFDIAALREAQRESWFDPEGFFLAENADGRVIGFHWTKVHPANPHRFGGRPVGEVYVVGVDPDAQGGGLGKALTLAGLRYLRERGPEQVILYVEGDNAPALAVYRKLGFDVVETDVQYERGA
ncbi:mycothiol synthase [Saccharomonospora glauca]|jgi:mycothiol synthase|uniref:Mycothiol acetyltransferase n=1 Tax=Saccharomonospora glauca K62 TaxID=928724 RepID=I1D7S4_9PSEU|nr:mycothiol synthase [Saccharomonospora glauca]EIF00999.1 mycothiol synthase [Saccharomonospora glauca K62]